MVVLSKQAAPCTKLEPGPNQTQILDVSLRVLITFCPIFHFIFFGLCFYYYFLLFLLELCVNDRRRRLGADNLLQFQVQSLTVPLKRKNKNLQKKPTEKEKHKNERCPPICLGFKCHFLTLQPEGNTHLAILAYSPNRNSLRFILWEAAASRRDTKTAFCIDKCILRLCGFFFRSLRRMWKVFFAYSVQGFISRSVLLLCLYSGFNVNASILEDFCNSTKMLKWSTFILMDSLSRRVLTLC